MAAFPDAAEQALDIFKRLRIPDMMGQPTMGEVCRPWVFDFVREVFGNRDPATGQQLVRDYFMLIPKKNSKSTISAGVMLTACLLHERQNDELLLLSATRETANTVYSIISGMVKADDDLRQIFWVKDHIKEVRNRVSNNVIKVVSLANDTLAGKRAPFVLIDELWLLGKIPSAPGAIAEATGGLASRKEGWLITLSTQSDEPPQGIFKQRLQYARQVRDGEIADPAFMPLLHELPKGFDWRHNIRKAFEITNPNLGASVSAEWLMAEYQKVKGANDGSLQRFLSKHANLEIGLALRSDRWAGADYWQQAEEELSLDDVIEQSEVLTAGCDGGGLDDMLAVTIMGRRPDGVKLAWSHAWLSRAASQMAGRDVNKYADLERAGELSIVDSIGDDVAGLVQLVVQANASGKLAQVGLDPHGIADLMAALIAAGIPKPSIVGISQGWMLSSTIQTCERWLASGGLRVAAQELTRWSVGNARIEPRGNAQLVTKQASGRSKIDALMSTFDAAACMGTNPPARRVGRLQMFSLA